MEISKERVAGGAPGFLPTDPLNRALFSFENPFWAAGEARMFGERDVCSFMGFAHPAYSWNGGKFAAFGYFNSVFQPAGVAEVFALFESWARARGAAYIVGPMNFKTCYDYRWRLNDFDSLPFFGEPSNPAHYPDLMSELGMVPIREYHTDIIGNLENVRQLAAIRLGKIPEFDLVRIDPFTPEAWSLRRHEILDVSNRAFAANPGFMRMEEFDFSVLYPESVVSRACRETSAFLTGENGELAGFCVNLPDPSRPQRLLVKTLAVLPDFRYGGRTFAEILNWIFQRSKNYSEIAFCLMSDDNMAHRLARKYAESSKTYALFGRSLFATRKPE
jgi:hypothetical protein